MQTYANWDIQEMPLRTPFFHVKVERFLAANGLRLEDVDVYLAVVNADGEILAGGGLHKDIVKCIAVSPEARSEGLAAPLVSRLIAYASERGIHELKLFTKPENQVIFESLGFHLIASSPKAILMENGRGLERYVAYLRSQPRKGRCGVVVMNANPFTLGHQYLLEQAAAQVDTLFVIPVAEEGQMFPYAERRAMINDAVENYFSCSSPKNQFSSAIAKPAHNNIIVLEGSAYQISAATFPTYFLKDLSDAAETQMMLDLDLYSRHIAPALDATVRFVGSEPLDALTNQYNTLIPNAVIIPRLFSRGIATPTHGEAISASKVRKCLANGNFREAAELCPGTTWPFLLSALAERALRMELDLPLKPGLVCPDSNGAHEDMDYGTMQRGIAAIRPFFPKMALAESADELRRYGIEAEKAMMAATAGVNTHRGAIFALGIFLNAFARRVEVPAVAAELLNSENPKPVSLWGARKMAAEGYRVLFEDWLPYYRNTRNLHGLLLRIISTLDDTCVVKRVGAERAKEVKQETADVLKAEEEYFSSAKQRLQELCESYAAEGISPGGAADMLALIIFTDSILQ